MSFLNYSDPIENYFDDINIIEKDFSLITENTTFVLWSHGNEKVGKIYAVIPKTGLLSFLSKAPQLHSGKLIPLEGKSLPKNNFKLMLVATTINLNQTSLKEIKEAIEKNKIYDKELEDKNYYVKYEGSKFYSLLDKDGKIKNKCIASTELEAINIFCNYVNKTSKSLWSKILDGE